jgi:L-lactate dehydrogenase complex protein LldF
VESSKKEFLKTSDVIAYDHVHRDKLRYNIGKYNDAYERGKKRYLKFENAKQQAACIKRKALANLPALLTQFESSITKNGAKVLWAHDARDAIQIISQLLCDRQATQLVKSKSMTTEELHLNEALLEIGVESIETDLGEFIVQVADERPYHIVTPAMHKSKEDVAELFHRHFNTSEKATPEQLTKFVRKYLREKYITADVGVNGANFLIAREGAVAVTENEGNALLSGSFPKTHIVIAGIEKVIPSLDDLGLLWPLLAAHGTGQQMTVYNNLFFGPSKNEEIDGPEELFVVLLDNGRSHLYQQPIVNESLACIRCGSCLNACPVYKTIGGYTYDTTYSGPIGSVITPHLESFKKYQHLSFASSLCGKCADECPVKIPIPKLLWQNRKLANQRNLNPINESILFKISTKAFMNRGILDAMNGGLKSFLIRLLKPSLLGRNRLLKKFPVHSFSRQWIKRKKK